MSRLAAPQTLCFCARLVGRYARVVLAVMVDCAAADVVGGVAGVSFAALVLLRKGPKYSCHRQIFPLKNDTSFFILIASESGELDSSELHEK